MKTLLALTMVMAVVQQDWAWTPVGPLDTYQTTALSYTTRFWYSPSIAQTNDVVRLPGNVGYTEPAGWGPKPREQASRLNVGTLTYAYDPSFIAYYGAEGIKSVDAAFAILNRLPKASEASADLSEFITQGNQQINYTARALSMLDLKSVVLQLMIEHMGLLGETHVFDLLAQGGTCGAATYDIGIHNFDALSPFNPSTYVNGIRYDFYVKDGCAGGNAIADAMEEVYGDPTSATPPFSAVATQEAMMLGGYYVGISRDDFGGLRYLYNKNLFHNEAMPPTTYVGSPTLGTSPWSPITIGSNTLNAAFTGTVGGVEKINYVKMQYDSLIGFTIPSNVVSYTLPLLTNYTRKQVQVWRTNTVPDIIISANNLLGVPAAGQDQPYQRTYGAFIAPPGTPINALETPQVISPTMTITINDIGPFYYALNPGFLQGSSFFLYPYFQFGSYDGTTNPPIAFPKGTSLAALLALELNSLSASNSTSPYNPIIPTNTTAAAGTGAGTVTTGTGTTGTTTGGGAGAGGG